jgi:hypothetical protein
MDHSMSFTPLGHQIATALLIASPLVITAFWLGTMLRRSASIREWLGLVLLWAVALPVLKMCFFTVPTPVYQPTAPAPTYYVPAPNAPTTPSTSASTVPFAQPVESQFPPLTPPPERAETSE